MRALVYEGDGNKSWSEVPDPKLIDDTDVIVQVDAATICGTDLHILGGDVPEVVPGRVLGHEAVGTVVEAGMMVRNVKPGDKVLLSCISACGQCAPCRISHYGQCQGGGGWLLGHSIDGVQGEYARVPFADFSCHRVPEALTDEQVLYLSDVLPTGYEVGVLNGRVQPGDVVAIVGAGPIGLSAILGSRLFSAGRIVAIDPNPSRRHAAMGFGADLAVDPAEAAGAIAELSRGRGADVTIEAVGKPESFELCMSLVRPGGHVANVGVHGKPVELHMELLWTADITLTTGLVDTSAIPRLMQLIEWGKLDPTVFTTHSFALHQAMAAYDMFADPDRYDTLKVVMHRDNAG